MMSFNFIAYYHTSRSQISSEFVRFLMFLYLLYGNLLQNTVLASRKNGKCLQWAV